MSLELSLSQRADNLLVDSGIIGKLLHQLNYFDLISVFERSTEQRRYLNCADFRGTNLFEELKRECLNAMPAEPVCTFQRIRNRTDRAVGRYDNHTKLIISR